MIRMITSSGRCTGFPHSHAIPCLLSVLVSMCVCVCGGYVCGGRVHVYGMCVWRRGYVCR